MQSEKGNIATITAFAIVPLLALLGGALDLTRSTTLSQRLSSTLDSASLAAANLSNTHSVETVIDDYVDANFSDEEGLLDTLQVNHQVEATTNAKTITISATGEIDTYFLSLIGINSLPVSARSVATQSRSGVEVALVLDVSSSMHNTKLARLQAASNEFVDEMLGGDENDLTSISVIPFGGTVNIGKDLFDAYAVSLTGAEGVDPSKADYTSGVMVENTFRFSDGDYCIELTSSDFNDDLLPAQARGQVPHFWKWTNFNPWCPLESSSVFMNSNNAAALKNHLDNMTRSDGTGMDIGAAWGLKALSPEWQGKLGGDFSDRPSAYDDNILKVLVVMTDGEITDQFRPRDTSLNNTHTNRPTNNAADGDGTFRSGNSNNEKRAVTKGGINTLPEHDLAIGYFKRVCNEAKASDVVVYTIGFRISAGSLEENLLQYCASDSTKYYLVESLDIAAAFESIATSIQALRVTG